MIKLINITKEYNSLKVIESFNYLFSNTGLYVITGRSGSGKTTLFNIIMGIITYTGEYYFNNTIQRNNGEYNNNPISYITQDANLISYLTIEGNFQLVSDDKDKIDYYVNKYLDKSLLCKKPNEISGGEKQRISLIMGLLKDSAVFLCDEPTSQLDFENKQMIFNLLKEIAEKKLVICITHDRLDFGSETTFIDMSKQSEYRQLDNNCSDVYTPILSKTKKPRIITSVKKDLSKRSVKIMLFITVFLSIISLMLSAAPVNKVIEMIKRDSIINYIHIEVGSNDEEELVNYIEKKLHAKEVVSDISTNAIYEEERELDNPVPSQKNFYPKYQYYSLPEEQTLFYNKANLHGRYPVKANEVVLSSGIIMEFFPSNSIDEIVGKQIDLEFKEGIITFKVVGVFDNNDNEWRDYLKTNAKIDTRIYFSTEFTKMYTSTNFDSGLFPNRRYILYYETTSDLFAELKNPNNTFFQLRHLVGNYGYFIENFNALTKLLVFLSILIMIITILMFIQSQFINFRYKVKDLSIYNYYGFSIKTIKRSLLYYSIKETLWIIVGAVMMAYGFYVASNTLFKVHIFKMPYLMIDYVQLLVFTILIVLVVVVVNLLMFKIVKINKWYENLIEWRDLL